MRSVTRVRVGADGEVLVVRRRQEALPYDMRELVRATRLEQGLPAKVQGSPVANLAFDLEGV